MSIETTETKCQWCSTLIPPATSCCPSCGAIKPNPELTVPGLNLPVSSDGEGTEASSAPENDIQAQFLRQLEQQTGSEPASETSPREPFADAGFVVMVILIVALFCAFVGWFLLAPVLANGFETYLGVEHDGPPAFRRMGAFIGALFGLFFGAILGTMLKR